MTESLPEIKELESRQKLLFISMNTKWGTHFDIASQMFGKEGNDIDSFPQMMLTSVNAPDEFKPGSLAQSKLTTLELPKSVDDLAGVVITGSVFAASLLKRELSELDINREGKGLFLPFWLRDLTNFIKEAQRKEKPILGICFGAEVVADALGGRIDRLKDGDQKIIEKGWSVVRKIGGSNDPIMNGLPDEFVVPENHMYTISRVPPGGEVLAENEYGAQIYRVGNAWGIQFHPEKTSKVVDNYFTDPKNIQKWEKQGVNIDENRKLGERYSRTLMSKIFVNFSKFALSSNKKSAL